MPFHSRDALVAWLAEFDAASRADAVPARVLEQDGSQGANTGLVAVQLSSGMDVYIQPDVQGGTRWIVTVQSPDEPIELTAPQVAAASAEFATGAERCAFLEEKSAAAD